MGKLKDLLLDLGRDAALERRYRDDREAVMGEYELTEEEKQALLDEDLDKLRALSGLKELHLTHGSVNAADLE